MTMAEVLSAVASVLVGFALGATGAGGAILLVPLLVYGLSIPAERAAGQSAAVLGLVGSAGAVASYIRGEVSVRDFWRYLPGVVTGSYAGRAWLVEALPAALSFAGRTWPRSSYLMLCLAVVMLVAAVQMLRPRPGSDQPPKPWIGVVAGLAVGLMTGVLGAGGGFLLVPALLLASRLEPRLASGTSLALVAVGTAVAGVTELIHHAAEVRWTVVGLVALGAAIGMVGGLAVRTRAPQRTLRVSMAVLIVLVALGIVAREALS